jgi:hypothetical protein
MNVRKMIIVALGIVLLTGLLASSASAESRKHLIIVDLRHNGPAGFIGSKKAALSYLESQFRAGDEVSLLALSSIGGIQVIEDLTADTDLLRKKIADFHGIPEQLNGLFGGVLFGRLREYGLMEDLGAVAKGLAEIPGPKSIVFLSSGFPFSVYQNDRLFHDRFDDMAKAFAAAGAPVIAVNVAGRREVYGVLDRNDYILRKLADLSGGRFCWTVDELKKIEFAAGAPVSH